MGSLQYLNDSCPSSSCGFLIYDFTHDGIIKASTSKLTACVASFSESLKPRTASARSMAKTFERHHLAKLMKYVIAGTNLIGSVLTGAHSLLGEAS